ncbi:hypothetical protein [Marinobacter sp. F3R08]|uniref:hypothetical protein n=1 Tax=Marinobacter sp. F3R08 TaxID=2841559 RepID=UPI001C088557|nr:hypothetical protein [Marinobacter sp. F3R08]MBU2952741.1 hypothetical protein [Marinobacter sp. F3R08]
MTLSDKMLHAIVASLLVIFVVTYPAKMVVSGEISSSLLWVGLIISIPLTVWALVRLFTDGSSARKHFKTKNSIWFAVFAFTAGIPMIVTMAVYKGIPVFGHLFYSEPAIVEVTVERKRSRFHVRGYIFCEGIFYAKEFKSSFDNSICGLEKNDWYNLKIGDKVTLTGNISSFGFMYSDYKIHDFTD